MHLFGISFPIFQVLTGQLSALWNLANLVPRNRIVLGDVNGQLRPVFKKLSTLHAKNNFSLAIVAGNLFSQDDETVSELLAGTITVPLPTYFTVGSTPLPQRIVESIEKDEEVGYYNLGLIVCTRKR